MKPAERAAVASDRLLALENELFDRLARQWASTETKVSLGVTARWMRGRRKAMESGSLVRWVVKEAHEELVVSLAAVQEFLSSASALSWASLVEELKYCEAMMPKKYVGVAGAGLAQVNKEAAFQTAVDEMTRVANEMLEGVAGLTEAALLKAMDEESVIVGGQVVKAVWPKAVGWLKMEARRTEFEMINAVREAAMQEFNAAADRR